MLATARPSCIAVLACVLQASLVEQRDNSVRQLSSLLGVYNELIALRRVSVHLRRRCVFLENVQSLLRYVSAKFTDILYSGVSSMQKVGAKSGPT